MSALPLANPSLGQLHQVKPRDVWPHEAHSFTPWLAKNLGVLAERLGLGGLTLVDTEHRVGPFSLDILAQTEDGRLVAIENQLEQSNHSHLGQCITYAAGVGAFAVVWVLPQLLDEHRAAFDWLNEHTNEDVHFFGVELSVVQIGDSLPAPVFSVESRPNDWQKAVRSGSATSPKRPWADAHSALELLPDGGWTTTTEIAKLVHTTTAWVGRHFYGQRNEPSTIRMFGPDKTVWQWVRLDPDEGQNLPAVVEELRLLGITLDDQGHPDPRGFHGAEALEQLLNLAPEPGTDRS